MPQCLQNGLECDFGEIGVKEELQPHVGIGKEEDGVDRQDDEEQEENGHEIFVELLYAIGNSTDNDSGGDDESGFAPKNKLGAVAEQMPERPFDVGGRHVGKGVDDGKLQKLERPAAHDHIERVDDVGGGDAKKADEKPRSGGNVTESPHGVASLRPSDGKFG